MARASHGYLKFTKAVRTSLKERGGVKEWGKVSPSVFPIQRVLLLINSER